MGLFYQPGLQANSDNKFARIMQDQNASIVLASGCAMSDARAFGKGKLFKHIVLQKMTKKTEVGG
jgi:hypothetical protein